MATTCMRSSTLSCRSPRSLTRIWSLVGALTDVSRSANIAQLPPVLTLPQGTSSVDVSSLLLAMPT